MAKHPVYYAMTLQLCEKNTIYCDITRLSARHSIPSSQESNSQKRKLTTEDLITTGEFFHTLEKMRTRGQQTSYFPPTGLTVSQAELFTDGEFRLIVLDSSSQKVRSEKIKSSKSSFLERTGAWSLKDTNSQLKSKANDFKQLSLACDEPTDLSNTAQFLFA